MPFRKNHSSYVVPPLSRPVFLASRVDDNGNVVPFNVDAFDVLPDVQDFEPSVLVKSGMAPSEVTTIIKRPSISQVTSILDDFNSAPVKSAPVKSAPVESAPVESAPVELAPV